MRTPRIMQTTLQIINDARGAVISTRMPSESAQQTRANLAFAVREWANQDDATQQQWNAAAAKWGPDVGLPTNGCAVYKSLVLTKLLMGNDPAFAEVPDVPDTIPNTPDFSVQATLSEAGVFQLVIMSETVTGPFLVEATSSKTRGTSRFSSKQYRVLEIDDNFVSSGTSIGPAYMSVFLLKPSLGTKIAVQVTPLTANGFRGLSVERYGIVQAPPALAVTE